MTVSFTGFPPSAFEFLRALANDNTKAFFDRQRETYQREIAAPATLLVTALALELPLRVKPRLRGADLTAYRDSIVDTIRGPEVRAIVDQLVAAGAELAIPRAQPCPVRIPPAT